MTDRGETSGSDGPSPEVYKSHLSSLLLEIQYQTQQIKTHETARRRVWSTVSDLVRQKGVTEETKFLIAALGYEPTSGELTDQFIERLEELDEKIKNSAGQLAAWLTSETEQTSSPFNPSVKPQTETRSYFHVGLLPTDAWLIVGVHSLSIPIEKSAVLRLSGIPRPLSFEDELYPASTIADDPIRLEEHPSIDLYEWRKKPRPNFLLGDEAVKEVLDGDLKGYPETKQAIDLLIDKLF